MGDERLRATFICEATLGHVAFLERFRDVVADRPVIDARWWALTEPAEGRLERLPPFSSIWTARASLRARRLLGHLDATPDVLFFHTLAPALLSDRWLRRVPTVISVDATPINVDEVGRAYGHEVGSAPVEAIKKALVRRAFVGASTVIAWSQWVRRSLVEDYGVAPDRIVVQSPGVPIEQFRPRPAQRSARVRLLFVGGDFARKGGPALLRLFSQLPDECELDIVTGAEVVGGERVRVHRDVTPGDPRLRELYSAADVFVLPTRADTWGHAVVEAMASGLPVVTTPVGALGEIVRHDVEGLVVPPGDEVALRAALLSLVGDADLRRRLGAAGRARAVAEFDGERNLGRFADTVVAAAHAGMCR